MDVTFKMSNWHFFGDLKLTSQFGINKSFWYFKLAYIWDFNLTWDLDLEISMELVI
jgi:hypothetical protein